MGNSASRIDRIPAALAAACLLCPGISPAAGDYSDWTRGTDVILNTSASGANVTSMVRNFPILVRLTAANFPFSQAGGDGRDIRFTKADGGPLPHQIERWDSTRALAEIWVRVDTIRASTAVQTLRMLWGNVSAPDGSDGASVFRTADGFTAVWHLNASGTAARPNSVSGGNPAVPVNYDGDESRAGLIARADSLDGLANGDYLDVGDGYSGFTGGFTYSAWINPSAVKKWAHVLDLGNGEGSDNIIVNRVNVSDALGFHNWNGGNSVSREVAGQWTLNQWQHIAVTLSGKNVRIYRNGVQILADTMQAISGVLRTANFLGKSNWALDEYFQGKIDETELAATAHSADWIKLAYQNQKAAQTLVTVVKPTLCESKMIAPRDTVVAEGELLTLSASVECATGFSWSVVSGPSQRILDPEASTLVMRMPRISGDTVVIYRMSADFPDSARVRDVRVTIKEAIPDPVFTLPPLPAWSGKDSLAIRPSISNLAAIRASRDSVLRWRWTFSGPGVDTTMLPDGVMLRGADSDGTLEIGLCLDNGADPVCKTATLVVSEATASLRAPRSFLPKQPFRAGVFRDRDARGRIIQSMDGRSGSAAKPAP